MLTIASYFMEVDEDGPNIDCWECGDRIQHAQPVICMEDIRLHYHCVANVVDRLTKESKQY